jgi:hypothetical protein
VSLIAVSEAMPVAERQLWIDTQEGEAVALTRNHQRQVVDSDHFVPWSNPRSVLAAIQTCLAMGSPLDVERLSSPHTAAV